MSELVCQTHGPYDASYGTCPYCSVKANRPAVPSPLEDDMLTEIGTAFRRPGAGVSFDDVDPTEFGRASWEDVTELGVLDTSAIGILWIKEGARRGKIYRIKDGTIIGRSQGDIIMDDPKVSNPHAKLTLENEQFVIWDFGSKNGTAVNGERIRAATQLNENDFIKIGDTVMVLKVLQ